MVSGNTPTPSGTGPLQLNATPLVKQWAIDTHRYQLEQLPLVAPLRLRNKTCSNVVAFHYQLGPAVGALLQLLRPAAVAGGAVHVTAILQQRGADALQRPVAAVNGGCQLWRSPFATLFLSTWPCSQSNNGRQHCRSEQRTQISRRDERFCTQPFVQLCACFVNIYRQSQRSPAAPRLPAEPTEPQVPAVEATASPVCGKCVRLVSAGL